MTETLTLTVPTNFGDVGELAAGLAERVDEERLMLYGPGPFEDGTWVRFEVLLADQSAALEGVGRAVASIDGGDERPDAARFDIVLDSLQLEGLGDAVYERILLMRDGGTGTGTGQVDVSGLEEAEAAAAAADDEAAEPEATPEDMLAAEESLASEEYERLPSDDFAVAGSEPEAAESAPAPEQAWDDGEQTPSDPPPAPGAEAGGGWPAEASTDQVSDDELQEYESAQAADGAEDVAAARAYSEPPAAYGFGTLEEGQNLLRPSVQAAWRPSMMPSADPRPIGEHFAFGDDGLPVPAHPPRPDIDPSLRVERAPRPAPEGEEAAAQANDSEAPADYEAAGSGDYDDGASEDAGVHEDAYEQADAESYGDATVEAPLPDHEEHGPNGDGAGSEGAQLMAEFDEGADPELSELEGEPTRAVDFDEQTQVVEPTHQADLSDERTAIDINSPDDRED